MEERLEAYLRLYWNTEHQYQTWPEEDEDRIMLFAEMLILYGMMERYIPQSHYDQINEVVYNIIRKG